MVSLKGNFLLMQLIYKRTTNQSLPQFETFSLSVNSKNFSNTFESIKIADKVIMLYVEAACHILGNTNQAALLLFDAFHGQITREVSLNLT